MTLCEILRSYNCNLTALGKAKLALMAFYHVPQRVRMVALWRLIIEYKAKSSMGAGH